MFFGRSETSSARISSGRSTSTLDLNQLLAESHPHVTILSESVTLGSMSSTPSMDMVSVPPFPLGCMVPMSTILSLGSHLSMFPKGRPNIGGFSTRDDTTRVTITVPTSPRLRTMLKETLCISKWVESLGRVASGAPGHVPWEDVEEVPPLSWIAEGSIYPPAAFKEALHNARCLHNDSYERRNKTPITSAQSHLTPNSRRASHHPTGFRKALVFEREITLNSGGKTKRWSLQVPATTMNPEMVNMMLELQDLNSFFKDGLEETGASLPVPDEEDKGGPPSLMVSNSHCAFPLSLESSDNVVSGPALGLAARRGKRVPPPLAFKQINMNSYPSIPTAFLGSPSTYSPKFEYANDLGEPSLDLEDMVSRLRAQCRPPVQEKLNDQLGYEDSFQRVLKQVNDLQEDEWTFAEKLLNECNDQFSSVETIGRVSEDFRHYPNTGHSNTLSQVDTDYSDTQLATPDFTADIMGDQSFDILSPRSPQYFLGEPTPPPSTPLPPRPSLISPSSPRRQVRGILKSCKSVRFASLPNRRQSESHPFMESPAISPRRSTGTYSHIRRSSPRDTIPSKHGSTPVFVTPSATPSLSKPTSSISRLVRTQIDPNGPANVLTSIPRPPTIVQPSVEPSSLQTNGKAAAGFPFRHSAPRQSASSRKSTPQPSPSIGRHSLGRAVKVRGKDKENENKGRASLSPTPLRWTLNDSTLRRGSTASQGDQKSRMPVPFRNILTRFK